MKSTILYLFPLDETSNQDMGGQDSDPEMGHEEEGEEAWRKERREREKFLQESVSMRLRNREEYR